ARLDLRRVERGGEPALQVAVAPGLRANVRRRSVAGPVVLGGGDNLAWHARGLSAVPLDVWVGGCRVSDGAHRAHGRLPGESVWTVRDVVPVADRVVGSDLLTSVAGLELCHVSSCVVGWRADKTTP